ncbi:MAG: nickel pincer cofactor biosynthesis protein LarC [bacterium]
MPRLAYFDCVSGASGDMILGALVDAGVPLEKLQEIADRFGIAGLRLESRQVKRGEIYATKVDVHAPHEHAHRHLHHIEEIIHKVNLPDPVRDQAVHIFRRLAEAEAKVHHTTPEKIHFHEVGAVDAITDVVCSVAGLHFLGIEQFAVSTLPLGGGTVKCEHGIIPVPAPATVEMLRGFPSRPGPIDFELVTPTGAAILTTLAKPGERPVFTPQKIGYGAGSREHENLPNVLRLVIGETAASETGDTALLLETNIDDMNPEIYPYVIERLLEAGAMDAFLIPVIMKKGRPGMLLSVLLPPEKLDEVLAVVYAETTTLGVRLSPVGRNKLRRWHEKRKTSLGEIEIKLAEWKTPAGVPRVTFSLEFETCKSLAQQHQLPMREVYERLRGEIQLKRP